MPDPESKPLPVSSSTPPDFSREQQELFVEVLELLNRHQVPYAVAGAFALHLHTGIWRNTKDLDLFLPAAEVPRSLRLLRDHGFECEICDSVWLAKARREDYFVDLITGMSNGVLAVDRSWIQRAHRSYALGVQTLILAPEELIASKLFVSFRERFDGADIVHVIHGIRGRMDWDRLLALLGEHWGMLLWNLVLFQYIYPAHGNYIPRAVWTQLLGRLCREIENPDPQAPFRGSLIDENMFSIDVHEWGMENLLLKYRTQHARRIPRPGGEEEPAA